MSAFRSSNALIDLPSRLAMRRRVTLLLAAGGVQCLFGASAQTKSAGPISSIAHYTGPDRQQVLEAGARKEESLVVFSSTGDPAISQVADAFRARYPFLKVSVPCCLNSPTDVTTRALAEFRSRRSTIGVVETFVSGLNAMRLRGELATFSTPNSALQIAQATDKDKFYIATRSNQRGLAVNTKAIPLERAPRSWEELLDPRWKGRISVAGGEAATGLIAYLQDTQSKGYLDKLAAQQLRLVQVTARALAEMLVSGEVEISPTITKAHIAGPMAKGAPVAFIPIEPVLSISTGIGLPANSPAPHAAMLFIDFLTSGEGQQIYAKAGFESLSPAFMKPEDRSLKFVFPESDPSYVKRTNELTDLLPRLFRL
jgi:iron(III) transport system substrate-binding protein